MSERSAHEIFGEIIKEAYRRSRGGRFFYRDDTRGWDEESYNARKEAEAEKAEAEKDETDETDEPAKPAKPAKPAQSKDKKTTSDSIQIFGDIIREAVGKFAHKRDRKLRKQGKPVDTKTARRASKFRMRHQGKSFIDQDIENKELEDKNN